MANEIKKIVPNSLLESVFRNTSGRTLYVSWAGDQGISVKAGDIFTVPGDPRSSLSLLQGRSAGDLVKQMIETGDIEFLSSPLAVVDNQTNDGTSVTIAVTGEDPIAVATAVDAETASGRSLPVIVPSISYSEANDLFTIDWHTTSLLETYDRFTVLAAPPTGPATTIQAGSDRSVTYAPTQGEGTYTFTVTLIAVDNRTQAGTPTAAATEE